MCKQSTNTQTVVQNPTIPDWLSTSFQNLAGRAETASNQPFNPGVQKNVANFNSDQLSGFQTIRNSQGVYDPYMDAATGYAAIGGSPVSGQSIQNYMNPFTQNVIDSTMANINQNNTIQANNLRGNAALQGGLGNDRLGVAQAELARNQNLATNQTLANLQAQNYNQALGAAQQDRSAAQGAASQFSNLGGQLSNLMGQDASRLMTTGGLQQQLAQTQLDTTSANIAQQEQYPFATASWLGGMLQGASPSFTGTQSTTSTPGPSTLSQIAGLGLAGAGLFGLSDPRAKIDLGIVGELNDGTPVHAFKYKDDPNGQTHFGPMADDIARTNPEAVRNVDGMLYINPDMVAADQQNVMDAEYEDVSERDGYNTGGFTSYPGTHTVDKQAIVRMSQPQGQQTPMGTSNIVPAQSVQAGQMISAMSPVRDKVSRPKGMVEEAKGIADDLRPMMQAGKGFGALADQGMRTFGGFSMQRDKLGPPVPEGLADGGRVGYALGGMATGPYSSTGFNPTSPSLYGMPVPAPQPAARPVRAAGLGGQFSMPTQAPDVPAPAGMNEMETLAAANAAPQTAGWMTTVQPEMQTSPVGGQTPPAASGFGFGNMSEAARMGMIQAGLGMAAGTSPNALTNIGRGGMVGMQAYQAAKEAEARKAQEALQNRIAERKLEMLNEQWKQQQAEYADNRPRREAELAIAQRNAAEPGFERRQEIEREQAVKRVEAEREIKKREAIEAGYGPDTPEYKAHVFGMKSQQRSELSQQVEARRQEAMKLGLDPDREPGRTFVLTGKMPREDQQPLTATDKKAILEADEAVQSNQQAISLLDEALKINPKANTGFMAGTRAAMGNMLPDILLPDAISSKESSKATADYENIVIGQALSQMKSIFGAAPTEGERKILLELQGSVDQPVDVRRGILERAKRAAEARLKFNAERAAAMRNQSYYTDPSKASAGPQTSSGGTAPSAGATEARESKTIDGKTYIKINGQWYAQ